MDFTHFTTENVLDFFRDREMQLRERLKECKGKQALRRATTTRLSELMHLRHNILTRSQETAYAAMTKAAEANDTK